MLNDTLEKKRAKAEYSKERTNIFIENVKKSKMNGALMSMGKSLGFVYDSIQVNQYDLNTGLYSLNIEYKKNIDSNSLSIFVNLFDSLYEVCKFYITEYTLVDIQINNIGTNKDASNFTIVYK